MADPGGLTPKIFFLFCLLIGIKIPTDLPFQGRWISFWPISWKIPETLGHLLIVFSNDYWGSGWRVWWPAVLSHSLSGMIFEKNTAVSRTTPTVTNTSTNSWVVYPPDSGKKHTQISFFGHCKKLLCYPKIPQCQMWSQYQLVAGSKVSIVELGAGHNTTTHDVRLSYWLVYSLIVPRH